ncbi:hypothetical protein BG000_009254 [Podila horticola]|nr:hypothetical protein BG000_009254 [Podila horticola]
MAKGTGATRLDKASSESAPENDNDLDQDMDMDLEMDNTQQQSGDNPSHIRRKRLTQACDPCRKKKIKCDGHKPSCGNCGRIDVQCTYLPSMKKRGPRQGYIELLEKRLDKMEKMLQHGPSAAILDPELLDSTSILDSPLRPAMGSDRDKKGDRSPTATEPRFFGSSSLFSNYLASGEVNLDPLQDKAPDSNVPRPKRPLYGIREEIPRKDILDHLINLFFDSVYYQFPILHPATFMQQYKEGKVPPNLLNAICASVARFSNHPDVLTTPAYLAGEPFATNVRGVLFDSIDIPTVSNVQALIFLCMYEYGAARGPRAWMFGGMAIRQAQELGLNREDSSPIFYLRGDWVMRETRRRTFWACFMLDVLSSSSSGRPRMIDERDCEVLLPSEDNAWCEARPVVTEMLNNEHESLSGDEKNKQGDSASESTQSRDDASQPDNDRNMDTAPDIPSTSGEPAQVESRKPPSLSSLAYLIRALAILGRVSQYVNRPRSKKAIPANEVGSEFSTIDAALGAWVNSVPHHLIYSRENKVLQDKNEGSIIVFMHIVYHTAVVLLHRPILAADKASFPIASHFIENSTARCAEAANRVSEILEFVSTQSCPAQVFISSFFAYPVFTTATIHITNAFSADAVVAARARRSLSVHVKILQTMKSYWAMADKFFYIIRDLYSIQSKISASTSAGVVVPQVVSHNAHGDDEPYNSLPRGSAKEGQCERTIEGSVLTAIAAGSKRNKETAMVPGMMVSNKSTSISSFLKSDSGLIALWRRATEMQVIDGANQEKRKVTFDPPLERHVTTANVDKELHEQRLRLDQLEIEEINAEFERQRKERLDVGMTQDLPREESLASSTHNTHVIQSVKPSQPQQLRQPQQPQQPQQHSQQDEPLALEDPHMTIPPSEAQSLSKPDSTLAEKRQKDEVVNPRAAKLSKVAKAPAPRATTRKPRSNSGASIAGTTSGTWNPLSGAPSEPIPTPGSMPFQQLPKLVVQPQAVFDVSSMPTNVNADSGVARHLLDVYNQQHCQQETLSQTIDMAQNAVIQKQQMELQQQQQRAQMTSSLAFGPPGGFSSYTPSQSDLYSQPIQTVQQRSFPQQPAPQQQQQQQQQIQQQRQQPSQQHQHQQSVSSVSSSVSSSGYVFGASPAYTNQYSDQSSVAPGPQESIFDFAFPMSDISFLSSSFQVPSNMMQERGLYGATNNSGASGATLPSMMNKIHVTNSVIPAHVNQARNTAQVPFQPAPARQIQQQPQQHHLQHHQPQPQLQQQQQQQQQHQMQHHSQSPTGSNKSQSISPSMASLMMTDDSFDAQSTPNSLMRYLQHHQQQQEQQQQLQQQQDMQPLLLNNQNSLIYDDYYQWNN